MKERHEAGNWGVDEEGKGIRINGARRLSQPRSQFGFAREKSRGKQWSGEPCPHEMDQVRKAECAASPLKLVSACYLSV